jgi:hypothetical protein
MQSRLEWIPRNFSDRDTLTSGPSSRRFLNRKRDRGNSCRFPPTIFRHANVAVS